MKYSFLIPVYNRPEEVDELLQSLTAQSFSDFEVIVVDDGSSLPCREVTERYAGRLDLHYHTKPNSGPGQTRNYAAERARGEYLLILDSDVIVPPGYLEAIEAELQREPCDAFGGPDRAHDSFTPMQKAINYAMTSFFTTGGIRGGRKKMDKFYPRSFNMGVRREVYQALDGFSRMRFGEDIDFSIRIFRGGYRCRLFPDAWVWHKRADQPAEILQAGAQLGHRAHQPLQEISRLAEGCPPPAGTLHAGHGRVAARHPGMPLLPAATGALCPVGLPGLGGAKPQPAHRPAVHSRGLRATYRLRQRILACLVAALRAG